PSGCTRHLGKASEIKFFRVHKCIIREHPQRGFGRSWDRHIASRRNYPRPFHSNSQRGFSEASECTFNVTVPVARNPIESTRRSPSTLSDAKHRRMILVRASASQRTSPPFESLLR